MNTLNLYIMVRLGLHQDSSISHDTLDQILKGVESGNRDNIYFYGLLKLYGISLSADAAIAAQHFLRASNLGHKDATTAYGVMLLTGRGMQRDQTMAMNFFRRAMEMGDMVSYMLWLMHSHHSSNLTYIDVTT